MVDIVSKLCSHDTCVTRPRFNIMGSKKPAFCKQHAQDGMVDVFVDQCLQESCTKTANFNIEGGETAMFCTLHAECGMVNVRRKRCSRTLHVERRDLNDNNGEAPAKQAHRIFPQTLTPVAQEQPSAEYVTAKLEMSV
ncbi:unnamed protein product [Laminaria digitata]